MSEPEHDEPRTRIIAYEPSPGHRMIAVVHRDEETDRLSPEEIFEELEEWRRAQRHLRVVDDE